MATIADPKCPSCGAKLKVDRNTQSYRLCGVLPDRAEADQIRYPPHELIELTCRNCGTAVLGVLVDERW